MSSQPSAPVLRLEDLGDVLTVEEVAAVLRLKKSAIYVKARAGIIPPIELGAGGRQCTRFAKRTIEALLNGTLAPNHASDGRSARPRRGTRR